MTVIDYSVLDAFEFLETQGAIAQLFFHYLVV